MPSSNQQDQNKNSQANSAEMRIEKPNEDTSEFTEFATAKPASGTILKNYRLIPIRLITPDPDQPRKVQMDSPALKELSESIKEHGVMNPIHVREIQEDEKGKRYQIVNGERRYWASVKAKLKEIPAKILELTEDSEKAIQQLVDNLHREDLLPLEEAEGYQKLIENFNFTHEQVAKKVGKARNTVTEILSLNTLPEKIKEACRQSNVQIPKRFLRYLARQQDEKLQLSLFKKYLKTSEPTERIINKDKDLDSEHPPLKMFAIYSTDLNNMRLEIKAYHTGIKTIDYFPLLEQAIRELENRVKVERNEENNK
jgi:ParB family chromosome partitioning protein